MDDGKGTRLSWFFCPLLWEPVLFVLKGGKDGAFVFKALLCREHMFV
jgi:hypothetical protein